jgi:hypothetical protein
MQSLEKTFKSNPANPQLQVDRPLGIGRGLYIGRPFHRQGHLLGLD